FGRFVCRDLQAAARDQARESAAHRRIVIDDIDVADLRRIKGAARLASRTIEQIHLYPLPFLDFPWLAAAQYICLLGSSIGARLRPPEDAHTVVIAEASHQENWTLVQCV